MDVLMLPSARAAQGKCCTSILQMLVSTMARGTMQEYAVEGMQHATIGKAAQYLSAILMSVSIICM